MIRKQVFIREDQERRLKALANRAGIAEAEIIRDGIDRALAERETADDGWKQVILEVAGIWKDRDDIEDIVEEGRRLSQERSERLMHQWRGDDAEDE
jgi:hypothetical protein